MIKGTQDRILQGSQVRIKCKGEPGYDAKGNLE
jgi:hypothetical protein